MTKSAVGIVLTVMLCSASASFASTWVGCEAFSLAIWEAAKHRFGLNGDMPADKFNEISGKCDLKASANCKTELSQQLFNSLGQCTLGLMRQTGQQAGQYELCEQIQAQLHKESPACLESA